jgi:hypothetical protein
MEAVCERAEVQMKKTLKTKTLKDLEVPGPLLTTAPRLENEPPHRRLARLTREHAEITLNLQELKKEWAQRNIKAQAVRQPVSTPEITHFENQKRELALTLLNIQTQIGATNKELRQRKAVKQQSVSTNGSKAVSTKEAPLKEHREYPIYFLLAARNELDVRLFASVERAAKSMLQHALETGVQE